MSSDHKITGASQAGATQSSIFQQVSLKTAIVAALVAIGAIALVYAEVKYRFVSTIVSFVVANPLIMGVIALVALVGIGYLLYKNGKHSNTNHLQNNEVTHVNSLEEDEALDRETDQWLRTQLWTHQELINFSTEPPIGLDVQSIEPASEEELVAAMRADQTLNEYFVNLFGQRSQDRVTLNGARRMCNYLLRYSENRANSATNEGSRREREGRIDRFRPQVPLALRWLMNPMILNQNNNATN